MKTLDILRKYYSLILLILSLLLFPLFLGSVHLFDWDEVNFAEISREMIVTNNYLNVQINYLPFWEKPPLFFWLQALSMNIFGINEYASRLPNAIIGIFTIMYLYHLGKKNISERFGFIWALAYFGSFLPHFYFKSGIIDPLFNLLIYISIYQFYRYSKNDYAKKYLLLASFFAGLAVLTKGPVAIIIIFGVALFYVVYQRQFLKVKVMDVVIALSIIAAISSFWFIAEITKGGGLALFKEFINYQIRLFTTSEAGHGQPFYYHFVVIFIGCFPISLIAFPYILRMKPKDEINSNIQNFYVLHFILFWFVLVLFSITKTKIVHYSSMTYFPLSFLAAFIINKQIEENKPIKKISFVLITIIGVLFSIVFSIFPFIVKFKDNIIPFIKDEFVVGNLQIDSQWSGFEFLIGVAYFSMLIYLLYKIKQKTENIIFLFVLNAIVLNVLLFFIVPKVEQHVQGSLIHFFKQHQNKNEYLMCYGFKSYAQYFYTNKQKPDNINALNDTWLLEGDIDKPVYIACKIFDKDSMNRFSNTKYLYEKGGFAFFVRMPSSFRNEK